MPQTASFGHGTALMTLVLGIGVIVGYSGDSGSDATVVAPPVPAVVPALAVGLPLPEVLVASPVPGGCGVARPTIGAAFQAAGQEVIGLVLSIKVGSCRQATVTTVLGDAFDDHIMAPVVCDLAAAVAYRQGVAKVVVVSRGGDPIMIGTRPEAECKYMSELQEQ